MFPKPIRSMDGFGFQIDSLIPPLKVMIQEGLSTDGEAVFIYNTHGFPSSEEFGKLRARALHGSGVVPMLRIGSHSAHPVLPCVVGAIISPILQVRKQSIRVI